MYKCDPRRNFLFKKIISLIRNNMECDKNTMYSHGDKNSEKGDRADSQDSHESVQTTLGGQGQSHRAFGQGYIKWFSEMTLERSVSSRNRHNTRKKNMSILVVCFFFQFRHHLCFSTKLDLYMLLLICDKKIVIIKILDCL